MDNEKQLFYAQNINIAYKLAWKYYNKFKGYIELDELKSICLFGLVKAVKSFNNKLGFAFSTYAYQVIRNEVYMYNRSVRKWNKNISLNSPIKDNENILIEDILEDNFNMEDKISDSINMQKLYTELTNLPERLKKLIYYKLNGLTMTEIGKKLNLSQPQISRDYRKALRILRKRFNVEAKNVNETVV